MYSSDPAWAIDGGPFFNLAANCFASNIAFCARFRFNNSWKAERNACCGGKLLKRCREVIVGQRLQYDGHERFVGGVLDELHRGEARREERSARLGALDAVFERDHLTVHVSLAHDSEQKLVRQLTLGAVTFKVRDALARVILLELAGVGWASSAGSMTTQHARFIGNDDALAITVQ